MSGFNQSRQTGHHIPVHTPVIRSTVAGPGAQRDKVISAGFGKQRTDIGAPDVEIKFRWLFDIPDVFVVGYGLDYNNYYRNLPDIGTLKETAL